MLIGQGACQVTSVPVETDGRVSAAAMIAAMQPNTILVTLMLANNESGALQPVAEVARHCRAAGILFHTDAAQAAGKVSVELNTALGHADMVSLVGHKIGAPKGVACLYVRSGCLEEAKYGRHMLDTKYSGVVLIGGDQEFGRRGGTENVPSIVGFGQAAVSAKTGLEKKAAHMEAMRERLLRRLQEKLGTQNVQPNGPDDASCRLPNTLSVGLKGIVGGELLGAISDKVAASAGATCHSTGAVSGVLRAMKVPEEFARGTLRLSIGPKTTAKDVDKAADIIVEAAKRQLGTI
jgi:cysteine desulfurase